MIPGTKSKFKKIIIFSLKNHAKPVFLSKTTILTLLKLLKTIKTDRKSIVDSDGLNIKSVSLPGCPFMAGQGA